MLEMISNSRCSWREPITHSPRWSDSPLTRFQSSQAWIAWFRFQRSMASSAKSQARHRHLLGSMEKRKVAWNPQVWLPRSIGKMSMSCLKFPLFLRCLSLPYQSISLPLPLLYTFVHSFSPVDHIARRHIESHLIFHLEESSSDWLEIHCFLNPALLWQLSCSSPVFDNHKSHHRSSRLHHTFSSHKPVL